MDIGDVKILNNYQKYIWHACEKCGRQRWVRLVKGQPRNLLCNSCSRDKKVVCHCLVCGTEFKVHRCVVEDGYGKYCSLECSSAAQSERMSGNKHPMWKGGKILYHCEECGKLFEAYPSAKRCFCSCSCHLINQRKQGMFCQAPNKAETALITLFGRSGLPFKYTGNGEVWLGNRNPDFINANGKKQVIELLGIYWHPLFDGADRIEHYKQYGFNCLAIWGDEIGNLSKLTKKIRRFANA